MEEEFNVAKYVVWINKNGVSYGFLSEDCRNGKCIINGSRSANANKGTKRR